MVSRWDAESQDILVVLTRWPRPGEGKTRLARTLGSAAAHTLQQAFVDDTLAWALRHPRCLVAFTPAVAAAEIGRVAPQALRLAQPAGNLGVRLTAALDAAFTAGAERAVLVGSDSPNLPASHLAECWAAAAGGLAITPALDGGFVALGLARTAVLRHTCADLFRDIAWSTPHVAGQVAERGREVGLPVRWTAPWYDIDEPDDLRRLAVDLRSDPDRAPRTKAALQTLGHDWRIQHHATKGTRR